MSSLKGMISQILHFFEQNRPKHIRGVSLESCRRRESYFHFLSRSNAIVKQTFVLSSENTTEHILASQYFISQMSCRAGLGLKNMKRNMAKSFLIMVVGIWYLPPSTQTLVRKRHHILLKIELIPPSQTHQPVFAD